MYIYRERLLKIIMFEYTQTYMITFSLVYIYTPIKMDVKWKGIVDLHLCLYRCRIDRGSQSLHRERLGDRYGTFIFLSLSLGRWYGYMQMIIHLHICKYKYIHTYLIYIYIYI